MSSDGSAAGHAGNSTQRGTLVTPERNIAAIGRPSTQRNRRNYQPRPAGSLVHLAWESPTEKDEYLDEMRSFIDYYAMNPGGDPPVLVTGTLSGSKRGNADEERKSIMTVYAPKWNEFSRFAWRIGDIRSAIMGCDMVRPKKAQPVNPETMHAYMMYKVEAGNDGEGIEVTTSTGAPVIWKRGKSKGKPVVSTGTWNTDCSLRKFKVSMRMVHRIFDHCRNEYQNTCEECVKASEIEEDGSVNPINFANLQIGRRYKACISCQFPRILPTGDPTTSIIFETTFKRLEKKCLSEHEVRGCLSLTVRQVRQLRAHLLSDGCDKFKRLQLWTIILLAIRLFLRCDEVASIRLDDFATKAFVVDRRDKCINHLAVWVRGKADKDWVLLSLWRDDDNPEFCPIRVLMIYLAAANLGEGSCLFPNWNDLEKHALAGEEEPAVFHVSVTYYYIRNQLRKVIHDVFGGDPNAFPSNEGKVGTHTMRKTAYLFAVFGVLFKYDDQKRKIRGTGGIEALEIDDIEKAARHGTHNNASLYFSNNSNKYERLGPHTNQWPYHKVSPWRSIYYGRGKSKNSYEANQDLSSRTDTPINDLCHWFLREECGIAVNGWDPVAALNVACNLSKGRTGSVFDNLVELMRDNLPPSLYEQAKALFDQCCAEVKREEDERQASLYRDRDTNNQQSRQSSKRQRRGAPSEEGAEPKEPKISYKEKKDEWVSFKKTNKNQQQLYEKMTQIIALPRRNIDNKSKEWLRKLTQTVRCVDHCVEKCHGGDWSLWMTAMGTKTLPDGGYNKWKCKTCVLDEIKKAATTEGDTQHTNE